MNDNELTTAVRAMIQAHSDRGAHGGFNRDFPDGFVTVPRAAWEAVVRACNAVIATPTVSGVAKAG